MSTCLLFAADGLRGNVESTQAVYWWIGALYAVPAVLWGLVTLIKRQQRGGLREGIGIVCLLFLGYMLCGQKPEWSLQKNLLPWLTQLGTSAQAEKPETKKPKTEQPFEAAPATETPMVAATPKAEPAADPLAITPKEVKQEGNTFKLGPIPHGVYWVKEVDGKGEIVLDPTKSVTITVANPTAVQFYKQQGTKAGLYLEFSVAPTETPKASGSPAATTPSPAPADKSAVSQPKGE